MTLSAVSPVSFVSHLKVCVLGVFLSCYILLSIDRLCLVHVLALLPLVILS